MSSLPSIVSPQEAFERITAGAVLIDVREQDEWETMHVAASKLIPLGSVADRLAEIPRNRDIILICRSGRRSGEAQATLIERGYDRVANLAGGILAWDKAGLPSIAGPD